MNKTNFSFSISLALLLKFLLSEFLNLIISHFLFLNLGTVSQYSSTFSRNSWKQQNQMTPSHANWPRLLTEALTQLQSTIFKSQCTEISLDLYTLIRYANYSTFKLFNKYHKHKKLKKTPIQSLLLPNLQINFVLLDTLPTLPSVIPYPPIKVKRKYTQRKHKNKNLIHKLFAILWLYCKHKTPTTNNYTTRSIARFDILFKYTTIFHSNN